MKKLYLDIDGVFILEGKLSENTKEFLMFALKNYDCFWLSTYSKRGIINPVCSAFASCSDDSELLGLISKVKPLRWGRLKTEVIELDQDFYWLDDQPTSEDLVQLAQSNRLSCLLKINLQNDPSALIVAQRHLSQDR